MKMDSFNVEYADVFGIPFDFTAKPVVAPPQPPRETIQVKAVRPDRDALEIRFPRVEGYRVELPEERLTAEFNDDSILELTPDLVGPSITQNSGIIGEGVDLGLEHLGDMRHSTLLFNLTQAPSLHQVARSRRGTEAAPVWPAQAHHQAMAGYLPRLQGRHLSRTAHVSGTGRYGLQPHHRRNHPGVRRRTSDQGSARSVQSYRLDRARQFQHIEDATDGKPMPAAAISTGSFSTAIGKAEFCRVAESHPRVRAYVKNHNLGLEVPYRYGSEMRKYIPDFIVLVDDGTATTTSCISSSRSRATGARMQRKRSPRWRLTGCPA